MMLSLDHTFLLIDESAVPLFAVETISREFSLTELRVIFKEFHVLFFRCSRCVSPVKRTAAQAHSQISAYL